MKAGELWAVCWSGALFSVHLLGEVMDRNRRGICEGGDGAKDFSRDERAKDFSPLLLLDVATTLQGANGRRLELEKLRFGHALCGRPAGKGGAKDLSPVL